ncbi:MULTISPECIES: hypothetical protein [unclassified Mycolicibacterium]|uniref:hypothetical protein n=1 Tax=unclassified Mycolicibacterium TaxID=2636767 RepID=UPI0012DDDB8A|nr:MULTISPECIES: hypothetical protein [unclassified Mycolicibacterium]MUL85736.1 hypothetical protein [Mycolicibacterium sp. CBMA 329]MUL91613.1 hypothetical protein [Mycolicibacterium sp. CBMA 331]MUM02148.1 hypothetical protein [Mycolicibacterium sp. CBMA 334]MUM28832.1 hypothetical protein [Mycolicibacterium sp. CBMA 295]MUM41097.1 hypothetical protein [Mycolicibacterium sp. CBMA 247]
MRLALYLAIGVVGLAACSSPPELPPPPTGFPNLSAFTAVDPKDFKLGGRAFVSPEQISCVLDVGPHKSVVCGGNIEGISDSVSGSGCPEVRKPENGSSDAAYVISRPDGECVTARYKPITTGKKLEGDNSTCVVGKDNLVACIDADHKHGFVLQPSGSWTF